jgi:hypothetical protein
VLDVSLTAETVRWITRGLDGDLGRLKTTKSSSSESETILLSLDGSDVERPCGQRISSSESADIPAALPKEQRETDDNMSYDEVDEGEVGMFAVGDIVNQRDKLQKIEDVRKLVVV